MEVGFGEQVQGHPKEPAPQMGNGCFIEDDMTKRTVVTFPILFLQMVQIVTDNPDCNRERYIGYYGDIYRFCMVFGGALPYC